MKSPFGSPVVNRSARIGLPLGPLFAASRPRKPSPNSLNADRHNPMRSHLGVERETG
jgi:hypothetical protein